MITSIPKKIHYCWFGGNPLPPLALKCIESWKKHLPDYEIIEWNESNFPMDYNDYVREAYEAKKWAFVSDVARLYALVNYGGIYMDTDVEVLKPLDPILSYDAVSGFESSGEIATCIMATKAAHPLFTEILSDYDGNHFKRADGSLDLTTNVVRITNICLRHGLILNNKEQTVAGLTLFPMDYFCPKDALTEEIVITENTYVIHHFEASWITDEKRYAKDFRAKHRRILPRCLAPHISCFIAAWKFRGPKGAFSEVGVYFRDRRDPKRRIKEAKKLKSDQDGKNENNNRKEK